MKHKKQQNLPKPQTLRLKDNHTWKAPKGYKIVVIDRGAVSFNVPGDWHIEAFDPLEMYDKPKPDDNARLMVTTWRLPVGVDWSGLPLVKMLDESANRDEDDEKKQIETLERGVIETSEREDLELVWTQHRFLDLTEKREAYSRIALARGWNIQVLITLDFWVSDKSKFKPMWDELLHSLQLGRYIEDPTTGITLH